MSRQVIAVYPGTFDPITWGHSDMLRRAAGLFDHLIVAVATAHHKKTLFSLEERLALVRQVVSPLANVSVAAFDGLVSDYVEAQGGQVMVRGLRSSTDFDYEFQLAGMNQALKPDIETVFLTPSPQYQSISSTLVREIAKLGGAVDQFVPPEVLAALKRKLASEKGA